MYKQFNKEIFDNAPVQEQVEIFNGYLKSTDMSVNKLCESLGLEKATISKRFKRNSYKFDNENREYKLYTYKEINDEVAATKIGAEKKKKEVTKEKKIIEAGVENTDIEEENNKTTNKNTEEVKHMNNNSNKDNEIIAYISENMEILKALIRDYKEVEVKATDDNTGCIIDLSISKDKEVNRSFRIYKNVSKELTKLQTRYPEFRLQDMVNTALMEYCKKHNK